MAASKSTFRSARIETFKLKARPPRSRLLVYVIHGSGDDDGIWIHNWRNAITPRQSRSVTLFGLKYFTSYSLAYLIFNINRMEISQGVASDYNTNRHAESAFTKIAMVGYSNGTKIISEIGQDIRDNVKNIVMLGSICTSRDIHSLLYLKKNGALRQVMLHCGNGDIWPRVAAVANPTLFEDTGRHGTTIGNCEIVYHQFDHFYPLGGEYFREHIFPYLMDDVSPGRDVRRVQLSAPKLALSFALGKFLRTARFVWYCMGAFRNYLKR